MRTFSAEVFEFDSRLWRSLGPLVRRPGFLTKEFVDGRRSRYLPPVRVYLVLSLLFFLVAPPAEPVVEDPEAFSCEEIDWQSDAGILYDWLGPDRLLRACQNVTAGGGTSFSREIGDNAPATLFLFLPLIAAVLKLLYLGSGRLYVEHLLFCVHFHSLCFLLLGVQSLIEFGIRLSGLPASLAEGLALLVQLYVAVYLFLALKAVYGQGYLGTAIRYAALVFAYLTGLMVVFLLALGYTALTMPDV